MSNLNKNNKAVIAFCLVLIAVAFRTVFHLGANVELVTGMSLMSGAYLGLAWAVFVPLLIMAVSDVIIGNTLIFIFTWSAYLIIGLTGYLILPKAKKSVKIIKATSLAVLSSLFFFFWTNFGVWLLDSFGMYSGDLTGLLDAYIFGLPFLKTNLVANLVIVPLSFYLLPRVFSLDNASERTEKSGNLITRLITEYISL